MTGQRLLGTPTLKQWPGLKYLMFERKNYKRSMPIPLALVFPNMDQNGLDLLSRLLEFDPAKRISAEEALDHPYFDSLDKFQY
ncbi:Cyclin-dependent kinase B1-1 [Acorus calamus]|uniref:Cyclin-dependent kinase B1-1 n=1 Tax=Acorus calamus TaxID=4465 RepID=A0AAV9EGF2_ACOCL|nr:Cyclin-dependent kinase B1-1 [Acorus calamus]